MQHKPPSLDLDIDDELDISETAVDSTLITPRAPRRKLSTDPETPRGRQSSYFETPSDSGFTRPRMSIRSSSLPKLHIPAQAPSLDTEQNDSPASRKRSRWKDLPVLPIHFDDEDMAKIRRWIITIALVEFDVDSGPVVSSIFPNTALGASEVENIAFSALPDSPQFEQGSQVHSFRIREFPSPPSNSPVLTRCASDYSLNSPSFLPPPRHKTVDGFIYGYSYFTQRRDPSIRRGYRQRSITILTSHPYPALFTAMAAILGYNYESSAAPTSTPTVSTFLSNRSPRQPWQIDSAINVVTHACLELSQWLPPLDGATVNFKFFGVQLEADFPHAQDGQWLWRPRINSTNKRIVYVPAAGPPSLYDPLPLPQKSALPTSKGVSEAPTPINKSPKPSILLSPSIIPSASLPFDNLVTANALPILAHSTLLPHLWAIWETLMLCEPVVVCGDSPAVVGATVWWIAELARGLPLSQSHDIRPYVTIHDRECDALIGPRRFAKSIMGSDAGIGLGIKLKKPSPSTLSGKRANLVGRAGLVIGVTNPWLVRQCSDWNCVLRVESAGAAESGLPVKADSRAPVRGTTSPTHSHRPRLPRQTSGSPATTSASSTPVANWSPSASFSAWLASGLGVGKQSPRSAKNKAPFSPIIRGGASDIQPESRPATPRSAGLRSGTSMLGDTCAVQLGWLSKPYKRYISKDRVLLKRVEDAWKGGTVREQIEATMLLRQHFNTRTTELLLPLTRYLNTLIPSPAELASHSNGLRSQPSSACSSAAASPALSFKTPSILSTTSVSASSTYSIDTQDSGVWADGVRLKAFSRAAFFESLKSNGCPLPFKSSSQQLEFYERWLKCKAFGVWLARQEEVVKDVLQGALA